MIPPPPAPDAVLFRSSTGRVVAGVAGVAVLILLVGAGVLMGLAALRGRPVDVVHLPPVVFLFVTALGVPLAVLLRSPHWVRLSAAGVEIGTPFARAVLIPWPGVESARVRGLSLLADLHVVPHRVAMAAVQDADAEPPRLRRRGGRRGYPVLAGLFPGGPEPVVAALRARGVPEARTTAAPR